MESTIAKLLQEFEQGRMSRRQLIRSLAIAATGAHALRSVSPAQAAMPATQAAPFHTVSLDHISYAVADYGRSRDFYADLMGWEVQSDNGESQATLRIGGVGEIIVRNNRRPMNQPSNEPGRQPVTGVINHIAWRIDDFDTDAVRRGPAPFPSGSGAIPGRRLPRHLPAVAHPTRRIRHRRRIPRGHIRSCPTCALWPRRTSHTRLGRSDPVPAAGGAVQWGCSSIR